ncbi:MAG: hypothetical protein ACRD3T_08710 [Terriglobia bacterium]
MISEDLTQTQSRRSRANSATGPKTEAGKARVTRNLPKRVRSKPEVAPYAPSLLASMLELGEDPEALARIRQGLIDSFHPNTPAEAMLVDDITSLRWDRHRLERAQAALLARRVQELEIKRQKESLQVSQKITDQIPVKQLRLGMMWAGDSATKFQKLLKWLEELKLMLETGHPQAAPPLIEWIYGGIPTLRAVAIQSGFEALAEAKAAKTPKTEGSDMDEASHPAEDPFQTALGRELLAEICNITQQYQLFIREHVEITPTMREECLAPTAEQRWLMRQMNSIDRQIERKTRLLLEVQDRAGRPRKARKRNGRSGKNGEENGKA